MLNKKIESIKPEAWADFCIEEINISFEKIIITLSRDPDNLIYLTCNDYIGFEYLGHWDESIIKDITIENNGNLIDKSIKTIVSSYGEKPLVPGGGKKNIHDLWLQVNIKLIDNIFIRIACKSIECKKK